MLKTPVEQHVWLIPQHQHAQISGYLAAHWGGVNGFARPGAFLADAAPHRAASLRDEVVLGIAEHDNGWWETEAMPRFSARDGLPVGLGEAAAPSPANEFDAWRQDGFERWRLGIARLATRHPYAALLTSLHAYWLYAVTFEDLMAGEDDSRRHFIFGAPEVAAGLAKDAAAVRQFLDEQQRRQTEFIARVERDPRLAGAVADAHLRPHLRLLQLLDALSLFLSMNDQREHRLPHVPRGSWADRVTLNWRREDELTIRLDPYPFDLDPLPVPLPVRLAPRHASWDRTAPLTHLHRQPLAVIPWQLTSGTASMPARQAEKQMQAAACVD